MPGVRPCGPHAARSPVSLVQTRVAGSGFLASRCNGGRSGRALLVGTSWFSASWQTGNCGEAATVGYSSTDGEGRLAIRGGLIGNAAGVLSAATIVLWRLGSAIRPMHIPLFDLGIAALTVAYSLPRAQGDSARRSEGWVGRLVLEHQSPVRRNACRDFVRQLLQLHAGAVSEQPLLNDSRSSVKELS